VSTALETGAALRRVAIGTVALEHGGALGDVRIACELHGPQDAPAVLVLGGVSAGRRLLPRGDDAGWWPGVAGRGLALDPARYRVLSVDWLGGRGESAASALPPVLTTRDQATVLAALLDALDISRLHCIVGASYGGMVALAFAERYPGRSARFAILGAAHRSHPYASALRSLQRRIIRLGVSGGDPARAVGIARALAMTTYRTQREFEERFGDSACVVQGAVRLPVDEWFDRHALRYASSFPPAAFLTLSQSLDLHRVDPERIADPCALVAFDPDTLVPVSEIATLAAALGTRSSLDIVPTGFGHDGFLKEYETVGTILRRTLDNGCQPESTAISAVRSSTSYAARAGSYHRNPETVAVRAGIGADTQHGAVIPPLHLSTTYSFEAFAEKRRYDYTRSGNPTRDLFAAAVAELELGAGGVVTASGMAAVATTLQLLRPGDLLVAAHDGYGGTYRLLSALAQKHAFRVRFEDLTQTAAPALIRSLRPRMVWLETPSNPLLRITDIAAVASAAMMRGRCASPTTPSFPPRCRRRLRTAPTSSCTRQRST
jgi:homoserine O-acetyltransferase/O-succinyltransferase